MSGPLSIDQVMGRALNGLALRQRVIANNVANVDTPGFKSSEVRFEQLLAQAAQRGLPGNAPEAEVVTNTDTSLRDDGNNVDIEQQMLHLSETAITYIALSRLETSRLSLLKTVATEGKR